MLVFLLKYLLKDTGPQKECPYKLSLASEGYMLSSLLSNCLKSIFKCLKKKRILNKEFYFLHLYRQPETEIQCAEDILALFIYLYNLECSQSPALEVGPYILTPTESQETYSAKLEK